MSRTKEYGKNIEILHLLHNAITKTLQSWDAFARGEVQYLEPNGPESLRESYEASLASVEKNMTELRFRKLTLRQRIDLFDGMRNGVSLFQSHYLYYKLTRLACQCFLYG